MLKFRDFIFFLLLPNFEKIKSVKLKIKFLSPNVPSFDLLGLSNNSLKILIDSNHSENLSCFLFQLALYNRRFTMDHLIWTAVFGM